MPRPTDKTPYFNLVDLRSNMEDYNLHKRPTKIGVIRGYLKKIKDISYFANADWPKA